jgi:cysteine desulfurase
MPIYLDNSTTAKPSEKAISLMMPFLTHQWGIPSAPHHKGQELFPALFQSYKTLYECIGAQEKDQFVFTSSGAEAVNQVIFSVYKEVTVQTGKNQFLTSILDEAPAIMGVGRLEQLGCVCKMIPAAPQGYVTAEALAEAISPRTALVSLSWANGLTGVIQPLKEIADLCKQRGIFLHIDATHVLGKLFYELDEVGADFISFNGDQFHAPKGTGGLYIRYGVKCSPLISGGSEQGGLRGTAVNMPGLVSLACAAKEAIECRDLVCTEVARLRSKLEQGIKEVYPKAYVCFEDQERLPNCTTIIFPGIVNESLLYALNRKGVYASIGGSAFQQIGLLLQACGIDEKLAQCAIAFSLSRYTTDEEIDSAIVLIGECAQNLSKISKELQ